MMGVGEKREHGKEERRSAWLITAYYVLVALLLAARLTMRKWPSGWTWLEPYTGLALEWLLWILLLSLPLIHWIGRLDPQRRRLLSSRLMEWLRAPIHPMTVLVIYELAVIYLIAYWWAGIDEKPLQILEVAFWIFLLFLPAALPYIASLTLSLPGPGGGNVKLELTRLNERIEEEKRRIDRMTYEAERVIHTLTSLVFTPEKQIDTDVRTRLLKRRTAIIGCADFTEQRLLCAMLADLLEHDTPFDHVIPEFDLGGAARNFVALARGGTDVLPVYTWTGFELLYPTLLTERKRRARWADMDPSRQLDRLNESFDEQPHRLNWTTLLGFYNDWEMVIRRSDAKKLGLEGEKATLSNLKPLSGRLTLGCEPDFYHRRNGLGILQERSHYGIRFKDIVVADHREVYDLLRDGEVDVIDGFTTDPDRQAEDLLHVKDDRKWFGTYHTALVVGQRFLDACENEGIEIRHTLEQLRFRDDELEKGESPQQRWEKELRAMIHTADRSQSHHYDTVRSVARDFLSRRGLV